MIEREYKGIVCVDQANRKRISIVKEVTTRVFIRVCHLAHRKKRKKRKKTSGK